MINLGKNTPNFLTSLRIFLIPFYLFLFSNHYYVLAFFIFFVASITDIYDGYLARKYSYVSNFGIFLDPFADKLLVISSLWIFLYNPIVIEYNSITKYMVFIIVSRDIFVTLLRMILRHNGVNMVTSYFSKLKTSGQIVIIHQFERRPVALQFPTKHSPKDLNSDSFSLQIQICAAILLEVH